MKTYLHLAYGAFVLQLAACCAAQVQSTWVAVPAPPLSPQITTLTPQQQIGGEDVAIWDTCCSPNPQPYAVPTNADGTGVNGYQTVNNVWGLDEGASTNGGTANNYGGPPNASVISPFVNGVTNSPFGGNPYGAYQYPASTTQWQSSSSTATVFMNISTFNPYKVFQSEVTFKVGPPPAKWAVQGPVQPE